jgi:hypothetical protein
MTQVAESLPSKQKALYSNPSLAKKKCVPIISFTILIKQNIAWISLYPSWSHVSLYTKGSHYSEFCDYYSHAFLYSLTTLYVPNYPISLNLLHNFPFFVFFIIFCVISLYLSSNVTILSSVVIITILPVLCVGF